MLPTMNQNLLSALNEYVYGHEEAKKALITLWARSRMRHYQQYIKGVDSDFLVNPLKLLLMGASGTGKSFLVDSLRQVCYFPLVKVDATHFVPSGGSGGIKPDQLKKLIVEEAEWALETYPEEFLTLAGAVSRTIVFVDEIDKLSRSWESSGNWNRHVQSNFLTMFDNKDDFAGVSFIFAGAFTELLNKKKENTLGFVGNKEPQTNFIDDDLINNGLIPELVGRINYIVELDVFSETDLYRILTETLLVKKRRDLANYGIVNTLVTDEQLKTIVDGAKKSGQGVRYMQRAVEKMFLHLEFDADLNKENKIFLDVL